MSKLPNAAVIGAGSSGIAAVKALHERGIDVECFEKSDRVGGNWVFGNKNGMSAAYRYLHINTSRERMQYSDLPMPASYPDFPRHDQIADYFDQYVDHFGFRDRIRFDTGVERAERRPDGTWDVSTEGGETRRFDMLLVANGHHWDKRWPEPAFPGTDEFQGQILHAHDYVDNEFLKGKDVVVLGIGNSAMDISVEASETAANTYLAARRGAWIIPKYLFGKPLDTLTTNPRVPMTISGRILEKVITMHVGRPEKFGLPKPDHRFGEAHPTISGRIHDRIQHGKVDPRPNIARLHADEVEFTDGTRVHADVVIFCTGYKITFPFFDETFIAAPDNHIELFWRVFKPEFPTLAFVGLLQPLGAIMPLAEAQGQWIAEYLRGEYHLPSEHEMRAHIAKDMEAMRKRYVTSKRHTIQVDFDEYLLKLQGERKAGAQRAAAAGFGLPVPARSAEEAVAA
jgi:cation diffusion facilitator CzcD-associated flavoprotein CzcO